MIAMRTMMKAHIRPAMAAMIMILAFASPAAAGKQVPFRGSIEGTEIDVVQGTTLSVAGNGTGIATHLGRFTATWGATVNLLDNSGVGSFHLIAANGDSVFTTHVGQAEPTDTPGVFQVVEINTITGGTGRFAGATGSFILERLVDLGTGFTSGSFRGTISSPGAAH
jgi:hypothetical protein